MSNEYTYQYPRAANTSSVIAYTMGFFGIVHVYGIIRGRAPFEGMRSLVGGFHEAGKETLRQTAKREFLEEFGLDFPESSFEFLCEQSDPKRDPREHVIDHVFTIELHPQHISQATAGDDAAALYKTSFVIDHPRDWDVTGWAFDHGDSIMQFLLKLKQNGAVSYQPSARLQSIPNNQ
jgi:8-oxo-dGTP diphosphatase